MTLELHCFMLRYESIKRRWESVKGLYKEKNWTPWPESASELYRPSDRLLSAKLVPTFVYRGCHVVSVIDSYGGILGFLDMSEHSHEIFCCCATTVTTNAVDWRVANPLLGSKVPLVLTQYSVLWIVFLAQKQGGIYYNIASLFLQKSSNNFRHFYERCRVHSKEIFAVRWRSYFKLPHKSLASENGPLLKPIFHPGLSVAFCSFILFLLRMWRRVLNWFTHVDTLKITHKTRLAQYGCFDYVRLHKKWDFIK
jgi:hypothetical protein